ncbi:N-(5-amino-5-carboxypentanoyl)-L-cysteinyl-D-valine synthase [Aspergillus arachidicola]|uniref:N-(5-amino-5-carboxypentanoyl)-L-cysteinyl-D-valine synthase n=1 Tax=Aspergillus arachidicola TaxID=656916 RepID=A0A2G7FUR3_9EURO|nr:N-(5-amino-5-carboxypentanoyl)-L-cysteinyl-D-valine synthase [Aspergillus arachidicola]
MTQLQPLSEADSGSISLSRATDSRANRGASVDNGMVNLSNGDINPHNGNAIGSSIRIRFPGGIEGWKDSVNQITERCDMSGLATDPTRYQLASTGFGDASTVYRQRFMAVPSEVYSALQQLCVERRISVRSVILFAMHQMLKGFGNGSQTITASLHLEENPQDSRPLWAVSPIFVSHENRDECSVAQAIESIELMRSSKKLSTHTIDKASSLVKLGLFDLLVVFADADDARLPSFDFPLAVMVEEGEAGLQLTLRFSDCLFDEETICNFTDALNILLAKAATGGATLVSDIELLSLEQQQQLDEWNNTDGEYPASKRLHHLIEEEAERHEDKVAVVCEERKITYGELNTQANRLARYLHSTGIQAEQIVALFLDKSEMLIVTILGVWKSGAAYVPIDPTYPDERVRFVLDDTEAQVIIASNRHAKRLEQQIIGDRKLCIIHLESLLTFLAQDTSKFPAHNLDDLPLTSRQLAYVTYTSGTTGFPKGIFKQHTNVVNSITDLSARYGVTGQHHEAILLFSAYVFEPFVRQMLMALVNGHLLAIINDADKYDADKILPFIRAHNITYLNGTASVLQEYDFSYCPSLKRMILVGENLTEARYLALRKRFKNRILNEYGFTESAFVTALKIFDSDSTRKDTSLGRPVRNVKCYILNPALKRVPIGATGELHIGGLGISKGYLNRPDLTPTRFIPNPFQTKREKKLGVNGLMYKTGDLARWLPTGEVEYLGRADFQIKLRGIRIEPGEIEATLAQYPGVRTSLVVSKKLLKNNEETTNEHLVGYYVCDNASVSETHLLSFLEKKLPRYMIPTRLVQLSQIPVNVNGKADLRALPAVDISKSSEIHSDLRGDMEFALGEIWVDVLEARHGSISRNDNFFRLGGHSITCIQLIARIRERLSVSISVEDVFATRTLERMAYLLQSKQQDASDGRYESESAAQSGPLGRDAATDEVYMANSLQQGFVYHYLKNMAQSDAYIMQSVLRYNTTLSPDLFQRAWKHTQQVYPALRLRFKWGKEVLQVIDQDQVLDWRFLCFANVPTGAVEDQKLVELQRQDREESYKLDAGRLFRIYLIQHSENRFTCLFSCHHAILDGWSLPLLFEMAHDTYLQLLHGNNIVPPADDPYARTQRYLQAHREDHLDYWAGVVEQIAERCDMNALLNERSRYKIQLADYDHIQDQRQLTVTISGDAWLGELRQTCSAQGITLHSILQFVWHAVLHAYGGGSHTITGTTISGRNLPISGIERSVGLYINTLPLVIDHSAYKDKTIMEAIEDVQAKVNAMNSRGNAELGHLRKADLKHGLFDSLFVLENYPNLDKSRVLQHQSQLQYSIQGGTEKLDYPLAVIAREVEATGGVTLSICYASELFEEVAISELLHMIHDTLMRVAQGLNDPVRSLEYLSSAQLEHLAAWNATEAKFPETTLHEMFEVEANRKPEKTAVIYEERTLTYRELNERANRMAHQLRSDLSPKPNDVIALIMDKSEHMFVSILAVWKSGGAYVPIDPGYPDDRIEYILGDTRAIAVIADSCYIPRIKGMAAPEALVYPSDLTVAPDPKYSASNPSPLSRSTDLAYIIYTSGTTGRPKGVALEHHGVVNLQVSLSKIFGLRRADDEVILSFSNYVFDHFVEQMTDAILNGQTLLVLNDEMRGDKERLYQYIEKNRVTYLSGTPSVVSMYEFSRFKNHLRRVDCVGEAFSEPVFDKIRETFHGLIINGYGPTEVSITTHKRLYPFPERRTDKSIGQQVHNSTSYVLNEDMKRVPIGAVGELYLGGQGVARGYHNRPDVTAERFIPNPFQTEEERKTGRNSRLYKTGDLVRWIPGSNGEIEYLGRNDFQVKIRGLRIELGEIEAILSSYPDIKQSVVIAKDRKGGQKFLVGYYVADATLSSAAIRRFMQSRLPGYMVPSRLIPISKLPVSPSGKLDTKALPLVEEESEIDVVAPRNEVERTLCHIWAELLEIHPEEIGIYSDFFSLGGDSLKSTKLSFMVHETFNRAVSVSTLFRHRTIEALAQLIINNAADVNEITPVEYNERQMIPVSGAQERLLFIHEFENGSNAYNIDISYKLPGSVDALNLEQALRGILSRHEALRTLLVKDDTTGSYIQKILSPDGAQRMFSVKVDIIKAMEQLDQEMASLSQHVFRLGDELPWQARILRHESGSLYLIITFHHTSFDAWSLSVFERELQALYAVLHKTKSATSLPTLKVQYKDYVQYHRQQLSRSRRSLSDFWLQKLGGLEPLQLITDRPRPGHFNYDGDDHSIELSQKETQNLREVAKHCKSSLYVVLLSAYYVMLASYTNQTDIAVGIPISHRTHPQFQSIIGFFVNLVVLRVDVSHSAIGDLIKWVMKELVQAQLHQDMPFQEVTKLLQVVNDTSRHPLVQTVFNFEARPDEEHDSVSQDEGAIQFTQYRPVQPLDSVAKFDLNATVTELESGLRVNFNYATSLFNRSTIEGFLRTYKYLLHQLSELSAEGIKEDTQLLLVPPRENGDAHLPLAQSPLATLAEERNAVSLSQAFEYEASLAPGKIAIAQGDRVLSYADLNKRANQLSRYMLSISSLGAEGRVALMLDKSIETIVCILAIWKAGAAYVPLDPTYPTERVRLILEETQAKTVLVNSHHISKCEYMGAKTISIDSPAVEAEVSQQLSSDLPVVAGLDNLAYIIFTSGTSGKPKGVLVEQKGVLLLRDALRERYFDNDCTKQHSVLFLSNYVFDFSVEQLVLSVLSGHKLIVPPAEFVVDEEFYRMANTHGLSYLSGTPSLLQQVDLARIHHLQSVTAAGELLHVTQYEKMRSSFGGTIYNAYGITETTVYNIITEFTVNSVFENAIRDVLPGTRAYLLNNALQPVPFDAVGELYLAGDCVTRGYLNEPLLTDQRFLPNPFRNQEDVAAGRFSRLYKTGDLFQCRFSHQQQPQLKYLGRDDLQVKMRGYRIELSEVQNILASNPGVKECAVVAKYDKDDSYSRIAQSLVGYYTTDNEAVSEANILTSMKARLPTYMVPSHLCRLEGALPVTINGKLDIKRLPEIGNASALLSYSPPRNILEARVCKLWASVLGIERCGIDDDLFKLGGDSIMSLHLVAQIHSQVGRKVTVRDIFEYRTIRALHDHVFMKDIDTSVVDQFRSEQGLVVGEAPLLPIQNWFLSKPLQHPSYWNHTFYIRTPELDVALLRTAISELQQYHDAFRMRLRRKDNKIVQFFVEDASPVQLQVLNMKDVDGPTAVSEILSEWQSGFDLEKGPICAIGYLHGYEDRSARVWFSIHHIAVDTVSWQILVHDLQMLYQNGSLGCKGSSIRQWSEAIQNYQASESELDHWNDLIARTTSSISALPASTGLRVRLTRNLSTEKTALLLQGGKNRQEVSVYDSLLAAVGLALQNICPTGPSMVTIEGHGREEDVDHTLDVSRTMGWFTSMYPFEIPHLRTENLVEGVAAINERFRQVPARGIGYGALYGYTRHPLPQITVNYLGHLTPKKSKPDEWALAVGDNGLDYGLMTSPEDKDKSSSAVDVTAACIDGTITIDMNSAWSLEDSEKFISNIEEGLNNIINSAASQETSPTPADPQFTVETYTPYFEYLEPSRQGPTLFLLPPGEGGAESYFNNIVKHLVGTNMVAFNNYYLHSKRLRTFEELAEMYLDHVRNIQPHGPYHFIGWSFGGILAIEMSRRLATSGERIGLLGIIDTYFNVHGATHSIGLGDAKILDPIHHIYHPDPTNFKGLPSATDHIVLFKAMKTNDQYESENQRHLYEYYDGTPLNDMDKLLPSDTAIQLVPLTDDTHFSWARNPQQVHRMCAAIKGYLSGY